MRKFFALAAIAAASLFASPAMADATLTTSGSTVTGVNGLTIGSNTYNVSFTAGSCASVFGSCAPTNFTFTDLTSASAAATALLNVIGTVPTENLSGCNEPGPGYLCDVLIPYGLEDPGFDAAYVQTYGTPSLNGVGSFIGLGTATPYSQQVTFAKFSLATGSVPEPATWAMMLLGFGAIGVAMRRKRNAVLATA